MLLNWDNVISIILVWPYLYLIFLSLFQDYTECKQPDQNLPYGQEQGLGEPRVKGRKMLDDCVAEPTAYLSSLPWMIDEFCGLGELG